MKNLFAYGTLMCDDIMEEVSGIPVHLGSRRSSLLFFPLACVRRQRRFPLQFQDLFPEMQVAAVDGR